MANLNPLDTFNPNKLLIEKRNKDLEAIRTDKPDGFNWTKQQLTALERLIEWSYSEELMFSLAGYAGTGKTTLVKAFLKHNRFTFGVAITAPTHKARYVLEDATGKSGHTIQKLLGLRPDTSLDDYNPAKPQFKQLAKPLIKEYKLIVVDEAGMLSAEIFDLLESEAEAYNVKILFMGDPAQLPPVREKYSKAFKNVLHSYQLTDVVRQQLNNPLSNLLLALRADIENETDTFSELINLKPEHINEKGEGYSITSDNKQFTADLHDTFQSADFLNDRNFCRYAAYTNASVGKVNRIVRRGFQIPDDVIIAEGDLLMSYCNVQSGRESIISNSEDFEVIEVREGTNGYGYKGYYAKLRSIYTSFIIQSAFFLDPVSYASYAHEYLNNYAYAKTLRSREGWAEFAQFKNSNLLLNDIIDQNSGKKICYKSFDLGYSLTVHKTQGSTYNTIFINGKDIVGCYEAKLVPHLWYTALSRPTTLAKILL